jgi:aspartyl-tRNA(Asn)/glutamyl-tRNA(Gln) amidotransferase subunit A
MPLAPSLDTIGVLARSAADLLPLAAILANLPPSRPIRNVVVFRDVAALCATDHRKSLYGFGRMLSDIGMTIEHRTLFPRSKQCDAHALTIDARGKRARAPRPHCDPALAPVLRRRLAKGLES